MYGLQHCELLQQGVLTKALEGWPWAHLQEDAGDGKNLEVCRIAVGQVSVRRLFNDVPHHERAFRCTKRRDANIMCTLGVRDVVGIDGYGEGGSRV